MKNKLIFIETKEQAEHYLINKNKFKEVMPLTLTFDAEKILKERKIKFKTDDDYETESLYEGLYLSSLKKAKILIKNLQFDYKEINIVELFHSEIFKFVAFLERYKRLVKKIMDKEKPERIYLFEKYDSINILSPIVKICFGGEINILKYNLPIIKEKKIVKIIGWLQKNIAKTKLGLTGKNCNYIFFSGSKSLFEHIITGILKNKNNFVFRCHNNLQKSFIINRKYVPFYHFLGIENKSQELLKKEISIFIEEVKNKSDKIFEEKISFIFKDWLCNLISQKFMQTIKIIDEIEYLINRKKINLMLVDDTFNPFERTITRVCKKLNIPTIVIQHGVVGSEVPPISEYILAFGDESKRIYVKNGFSKEKIIVTGTPQYDTLINKVNKNDLKKNKSDSKKILYVVDAVNNHELIPGYHLTKKRQKEIFKMLYNVLKKNFPKDKLIVKGRENWDLNDLAIFMAKKTDFSNLEFVINTNKINLLKSADIVIIHYTTMGLEAMIFDKPVISVEFKGMEKWNNFANMNAVKLVYNEEQLAKEIKLALELKKDNFEKMKKCLEKEIYYLDGKATQRAVRFINKILSRKI